MPSKKDKLLYCSFCGKSQREVRKLIAGPFVFICDECIELCDDLVREEGIVRNRLEEPIGSAPLSACMIVTADTTFNDVQQQYAAEVQLLAEQQREKARRIYHERSKSVVRQFILLLSLRMEDLNSGGTCQRRRNLERELKSARAELRQMNDPRGINAKHQQIQRLERDLASLGTA